MVNTYFTLSFYDGYGNDNEIKNGTLYPKDGKFHSCKAACAFAKANFNIDSMVVTEWDDSNLDDNGVPEIIGSCNAGEAYESNYQSLSF